MHAEHHDCCCLCKHCYAKDCYAKGLFVQYINSALSVRMLWTLISANHVLLPSHVLGLQGQKCICGGEKTC